MRVLDGIWLFSWMLCYAVQVGRHITGEWHMRAVSQDMHHQDMHAQ